VDAAAQKAKEDKNKNAQVGEEDIKKEDTDPSGSLLAQTKEPLVEATKWLDLLLAPGNHPRLEAWTAGFEVFFRRKKWLRAMQCLESAWKLEPENPQVHEQSIRLRKIGEDFHLDCSGYR
jgi:peptide alpha-N-acetyltransferase